jgi:sulfotransferase
VDSTLKDSIMVFSRKTFVLLGGLPRSGSTLLCNILAQNPSIHSTATSGCMDVMFGIRNQWDRLVEHQSNPHREGNQRTKLRVLKAVFDAYYSEIEKPVVVEKCRGWLSLMEMAEAVLGQNAKVLVPVRNVADVLASFEKLHRRQSATGQTAGEAENYFQFQTVEGRCEFWMRPDQPVGLAVNRIHDALIRGFGERLHFVRYLELTTKPREVLNSIYAFLGMEAFEHDFSNVEQVTQEDDAMHGFEGLHTIRPRVEPGQSDWRQILGPCGERYSNINSIWNPEIRSH